ncbi:arsenical pump-driving ATPase [Actinomadura mexicana]|uniref:Arsenite efflux ATP-binding protein ArsA n=1 Tax=Actinomadura mexicana TaxID=134959 RepID=A0A239H4X4_9ACTN|nr:arsenical pump-driving ATPase [Actinomadura mexicana]SNS76506.1 arsenite efflux ATP-binding protein ArsA [Actinomadura mexicana]
MQALDLPLMQWGAWKTPFVFFTGKGGVGKTTIAGAAAVALADAGRRVLLVCTDPASNLDDLFDAKVEAVPGPVPGVAGLEAMNIDPEAAAASYRERVVAPYRGIVSEQELRGIEEQLAGECTVEVAAFDRFTQLIVRPESAERYDHILFDTAPTGHTLRLMNLPNAWSEFIQTSAAGASCLGPRSGLQAQREQYQQAVTQLADPTRTTLVLVSRPDPASLREAGRAGDELASEGIGNQWLIVNGLLASPAPGDPVARALALHQRVALENRPSDLRTLPVSAVPLIAYELIGVPALRALAAEPVPHALRPPGGSESHVSTPAAAGGEPLPLPTLDALVEDLDAGQAGAVLVMGKGGVGKTTIAAALAVGLARRGHPVHLSTTDPAGRPGDLFTGEVPRLLTLSRIDPDAELADYTAGRLRAAEHLSPERRALLEEDLRSPCTQEMAVFRAFSTLLSRARRQLVIVDTAPSGHTLRLLDLTGSYHRQVMGDLEHVGGRATTALMRLQDPSQTRVLIVTLAEATPVSEAAALQNDLQRAGIEPYGWIINATLTGTATRDPVLRARAALERPHVHRVRDQLAARAWLLPWHPESLVGQEPLAALVTA